MIRRGRGWTVEKQRMTESEAERVESEEVTVTRKVGVGRVLWIFSVAAEFLKLYRWRDGVGETCGGMRRSDDAKGAGMDGKKDGGDCEGRGGGAQWNNDRQWRNFVCDDGIE